MSLDEQINDIELTGETEAELIDQQTELDDFNSDQDELFGEDAQESDLESAYESFETNSESDYNGWDEPDDTQETDDEYATDTLNSEGYHIEDEKDLEEEVIEMEIEDGDIYAYLVDEDDNEIGFILLDEDGNEQEYYYVDMDKYEIVEENGEPQQQTEVKRKSDNEEFDLGITREGVAETTQNLNDIYREGSEVARELKETFDDINESLSFFKKKPGK
jgi:hypothetical protein